MRRKDAPQGKIQQKQPRRNRPKNLRPRSHPLPRQPQLRTSNKRAPSACPHKKDKHQERHSVDCNHKEKVGRIDRVRRHERVSNGESCEHCESKPDDHQSDGMLREAHLDFSPDCTSKRKGCPRLSPLYGPSALRTIRFNPPSHWVRTSEHPQPAGVTASKYRSRSRLRSRLTGQFPQNPHKSLEHPGKTAI